LLGVQAVRDGLELVEQPVDYLLAREHGNRRNVVDRLVGIQLGALAARLRQRIHELGPQAEQAELEYLEQAAGTRPDDDDVSGDQRSLWSLVGVAKSRIILDSPRSRAARRRHARDGRAARKAPSARDFDVGGEPLEPLAELAPIEAAGRN